MILPPGLMVGWALETRWNLSLIATSRYLPELISDLENLSGVFPVRGKATDGNDDSKP